MTVKSLKPIKYQNEAQKQQEQKTFSLLNDNIQAIRESINTIQKEFFAPLIKEKKPTKTSEELIQTIKVITNCIDNFYGNLRDSIKRTNFSLVAAGEIEDILDVINIHVTDFTAYGAYHKFKKYEDDPEISKSLDYYADFCKKSLDDMIQSLDAECVRLGYTKSD